MISEIRLYAASQQGVHKRRRWQAERDELRGNL
jgi:hypothetical protein